MQTITDWECICINDGSNDGSESILDEYARRDCRFKVIHQDNKGVGYARNAGLSIAKGEYIGFIDGDDVISGDWLRSVDDIIRYCNPDMIKMKLRRDNEWTDYKPDVAYIEIKGPDIFKWSVLRGGMTAQNFYRREILTDVRFPEGMRVYEDAIFNLHALLNVKSGVQSEFDGYWYRFSETSSLLKPKKSQEYIRLIEELGVWFRKADIVFHCDQASREIAIKSIRRYVRGMIRQWVIHADSQPVLGIVNSLKKLHRTLETLELEESWFLGIAYSYFLEKGDVRAYRLIVMTIYYLDRMKRCCKRRVMVLGHFLMGQK